MWAVRGAHAWPFGHMGLAAPLTHFYTKHSHVSIDFTELDVATRAPLSGLRSAHFSVMVCAYVRAYVRA